MAVTATHLHLKIFVDKAKEKVLFAEADGDFVEVLFSFLTLPLGTIVRLIGKTPSEPAPEAAVGFFSSLYQSVASLISKTRSESAATVGCFGTLYQSVASLGYEHFCAREFKDMLLHPRCSSEVMRRRLKINIDDTEAKYYLCEDYYFKKNCSLHMSIYYNAKCYGCSRPMTEVKKDPEHNISKGKGFFSKALKFIIMDNLQVSPLVPGSTRGYLNNIGTNDLSKIEERTVKLGPNELIELLKCTLHSTTPLTDLFLSKTKKPVMREKVPLQEKYSGKGLKINVKVVLNKSSKEFVYVEAGSDFINFLFSLLLIPLGKMLHLMEGQSCLGSIDALYKSVRSLDSQHFRSEGHKKILLRPTLPPPYICKFHLFPLDYEITTMKHNIEGVVRTMSLYTKFRGSLGLGGFMREEAVFIVHDNLTVKPFSAAAAISLMNMHKLSFSDLEERTLSLDMAEGISILRASLNSSCAISNGLLRNKAAFKQPKQELCWMSWVVLCLISSCLIFISSKYVL